MGGGPLEWLAYITVMCLLNSALVPLWPDAALSPRAQDSNLRGSDKQMSRTSFHPCSGYVQTTVSFVYSVFSHLNSHLSLSVFAL